MESKVPLPTDNIYKFYAFFGLLLIITSVASLVYVQKSTNDLLFSVALEIDTLEAARSPSGPATFKETLLEKKASIAEADKTFFINSLSILLSCGLFLAIYGFSKWHRDIQPIQDQLLALQLKRAQREERIANQGSAHGGT